MFRLIPFIAGLLIAGGVAAIVWYSRLSEEKQREADRLAMSWFGTKFRELAEYQQNKIRQQLSA